MLHAQHKNTRTLAANTTSASVEPGAVGSPEFARPSDARAIFGMSRSYLYGLIREGRVRSFVLRNRGRKSGIRMVDVASVNAFLRSELEKAGDA